MAGAVSKEIDRLRLLVEACTCNVCYAQPVSVEACTNMYTHIHTNMHIMCTDSTTKNIHHIINCDHSPRSYNIYSQRSGRRPLREEYYVGFVMV